MAYRDTTNDRLKSFKVSCQFGMDLTSDTLDINPGCARMLQNYEPGLYGGYRRINGYTKYSSTILPNTGPVLGVKLLNFASPGIMAAQNDSVYFGTGTSWTLITAARAGAVKYRFEAYSFVGSPRVVMVDETNQAAKWDGTTYTALNGAGAPSAPKYVAAFQSHIFLAPASTASSFAYTAPNTDTDFTAANGAGEINVGQEIVGIKAFRDKLYIFCREAIYSLIGSSTADFAIVPVTTKIGCLASDSIQEINGDIMFLGPDGIRTVAATARINDVELESLTRKIQPTVVDLISAATSINVNISSCLIPGKTQYRLFYATSSTSEVSASGIIGAIRAKEGTNSVTGGTTLNENWEWGTLLGIKVFCADGGYLRSTQVIIHGGYDGYVYQQESGFAFGTSNIVSIYKTVPMQLDDPALRKILQKLTIYYRVEGQISVTVRILYDYESPDTAQPQPFTLTAGSATALYGYSVYGTGAYGGQQYPQQTSNVAGSGQAIQFQFDTNDQSPSFSIQGFLLQYLLAGRR